MFTNTQAFSGFSVRDITEAQKFYGEVLGLTTEQTPVGLTITLGNGTEVFLYQKPNHEPATFTVLNFRVEDIKKSVADLIAAGIVMEKYEGMHQDEEGISWGREAGKGPNVAWFKDSSDNILSVVQ